MATIDGIFGVSTWTLEDEIKKRDPSITSRIIHEMESGLEPSKFVRWIGLEADRLGIPFIRNPA